jgi:hypothetical protein
VIKHEILKTSKKIMELKPHLFHFFAELQAIWKESKIYLTENRKRIKKDSENEILHFRYGMDND